MDTGRRRSGQWGSRAEKIRHVLILINRYHHVDRVIVSQDPKHLETPDNTSDRFPSDRHGTPITPRLQRMDRLRRKRAVIRSAVTRATSELQALLDSSDATAGELTENLNILELKKAALKAVDGEIEDGVDIDHLEEEMESVDAYQVSICRLRTRATLKLDALPKPNIALNAVERLQDRNQGHRLEGDLNDLEQRSRSTNLEIHGLPCDKDENLERIIADLGDKLDLPPLQAGDVLAIHRLAAKPGPAPPVLIRFASVKVCES
ncbi:hypothetical protein HPB47_027597 [Ixodes persulcatus]|uniref:Uncharacterized protein n=1 Tax=Ixodes persulcatus TaxID=34615 RepID=A0AC60PVL4_IXOPE|nr:hypothetical protein HPB47_027597 [Ixodes persulcatus]